MTRDQHTAKTEGNAATGDYLPADIALELKRRQIAEVYRAIPSSMALSLVGAMLTFVLLYMTGDAQRGLYWMALATAIFIFRAIVHWQYVSDKNRNETPDQWVTLVLIGNFCAGVQWGLLGTWLYTSEPVYRAMLSVMAIIGYVGGSVVLFSALRNAHHVLSIPAAIPAAIYIFFIHKDGHFVVGLLSLLLFGSIIYMAERQHRIVRARILSEMEDEMFRRRAEETNTSLGQNLQRLEHRTEVVKRSQIEAKRRAAILVSHVESTLLPVIECAHNGRIIEWNLAAEIAFGYTAHEASQMGIQSMVKASEPAYNWTTFFETTLNAKSPGALDVFIAARDGTRREARLYVTPIDIDGQVDKQAMRAAIIVTNLPSEMTRRREARKAS